MPIDIQHINRAYSKFRDLNEKSHFAIDYSIVASKSTIAALEEFIDFKQNILQHEVNALCIEDIQEITNEISAPHKALLRFIEFLHSLKRRPKYILLVGDSKTVPGYPVNAFGNNVDSDQRYTVLSDDDYHPWCSIGRISSDNPKEIKKICRHLIRYKYLSTDSGWHKRVVMTGWTPGSPHRYQFDDTGNKQTLPYRGYPDFGDLDEKEARKIISASPSQGSGTPASWHSTNETYAYEIVRQYEWKECSTYVRNGRTQLASQHTDCSVHNRTYDPDPLLEIDYWGVRNSSKSSLIHEINSGALIVKYIGHGLWDSWVNVGHLHCQDPSQWDTCVPDDTYLGGTMDQRCLTGLDVKEKINSQHAPPLILSFTCLAGMIEDPTPSTAKEEETFAEIWQRTCNAIGIYAATHTSPTYYNARIGRYFFRALVQGFNGSGPIKTVGPAFKAANKALLLAHESGDKGNTIGDDIDSRQIQLIKDAMRIYRLFGDPETQLLF